MFSVNVIVAIFACLFALSAAAPTWGGKHEHVVIHVPYHVHTVHHHHVKKVHVPVPVVKKVIVHEEPIIAHVEHAHIEHEHGGWW